LSAKDLWGNKGNLRHEIRIDDVVEALQKYARMLNPVRIPEVVGAIQ
jgi:hypothetical protein